MYICYITITFWTVGFISLSLVHFSIIITASRVVFGIGQGMVLPMIMVWIDEVIESIPVEQDEKHRI